MRAIRFRTHYGTNSWPAGGSAVVLRLLLWGRAAIEALWQQRHPGQPRPVADWLNFDDNGDALWTTGAFGHDWTRPESELVLDILLEVLTRIDELWLVLHPGWPRLYDLGVRYIREEGTEEWNALPEIVRERGGDCEDLSAALTAERRTYDGDRAARCSKYFHLVPEGRLYHIQTTRGDGQIEDASRALGMRVDIPWGFRPLPGVPFVVSLGMTHMLGASELGDRYARGQLAEVARLAAQGHPIADYLWRVVGELRRSGYDVDARTWERNPPDGVPRWVR